MRCTEITVEVVPGPPSRSKNVKHRVEVGEVYGSYIVVEAEIGKSCTGARLCLVKCKYCGVQAVKPIYNVVKDGLISPCRRHLMELSGLRYGCTLHDIDPETLEEYVVQPPEKAALSEEVRLRLLEEAEAETCGMWPNSLIS